MRLDNKEIKNIYEQITATTRKVKNAFERKDNINDYITEQIRIVNVTTYVTDNENEAKYLKNSTLVGLLNVVKEKIDKRGALYWLRHPFNTYRENKALTKIYNALRAANVSELEMKAFNKISEFEENKLPNGMMVESDEIEIEFANEEAMDNQIENDEIENEEEPVVEEKELDAVKVEVDLDNGEINQVEQNVINEEAKEEVKEEVKEENKVIDPTKALYHERKVVLGFMKRAYEVLTNPKPELDRKLSRFCGANFPIGVAISQKMSEEADAKAMEQEKFIKDTLTASRAKIHCLDCYRAINEVYSKKGEASEEEIAIMKETLNLMKKFMYKKNITDIEMQEATQNRYYSDKIVYTDYNILKEDLETDEHKNLVHGFTFKLSKENDFKKFYDFYAKAPSSSLRDLLGNDLTKDVLKTLQDSKVDLFQTVPMDSVKMSLDDIKDESMANELEEFEMEINKQNNESNLEMVD